MDGENPETPKQLEGEPVKPDQALRLRPQAQPVPIRPPQLTPPKTPQPQRAGLLTRLLSRPDFNVVAWVCTVISVPMAVYFFVAGLRDRDLTYYVNPVRSAVLSAAHPSRLTAFVDGNELRSDVSVAQVYVWNAGKEAIHTENILSSYSGKRAITISMPRGVSILEVDVNKVTRDVIGLVIDKTQDSEGTAGISWTILEHSDGFVVQVTYAGPRDLSIAVQGSVEGQASLSEVGKPGLFVSGFQRIATSDFKRYFAYGFGLLLALLGCLASIAMFSDKFWKDYARVISTDKSVRTTARITSMVYLLAGLALIAVAFLNSPVVIPFQ